MDVLFPTVVKLHDSEKISLHTYQVKQSGVMYFYYLRSLSARGPTQGELITCAV